MGMSGFVVFGLLAALPETDSDLQQTAGVLFQMFPVLEQTFFPIGGAQSGEDEAGQKTQDATVLEPSQVRNVLVVGAEASAVEQAESFLPAGSGCRC